MTIWKNTCGESWQGMIENGWEVSWKLGAFLFFIPKGAFTHHLLKQAVVALPLVGHVRSPRGIAAPAGAAGQGCISAKLPALPTQSAQGVPFWKPLFMGWYIATPSRRLPAKTCHRQLLRSYGYRIFGDTHFLFSKEKQKERTVKTNGNLSSGSKSSQPWYRKKRCCSFRLSELF